MPTKIVTTITSPGKLRLAALFKSTSETPQAPSSTILQGRSLAGILTGYGLVAEVVRTKAEGQTGSRPGAHHVERSTYPY